MKNDLIYALNRIMPTTNQGTYYSPQKSSVLVLIDACFEAISLNLAEIP